MKAPPASEAAVPSTDMPPLVPAGTRRKFVMRRGALLSRMPTSDAHVSPASESADRPRQENEDLGASPRAKKHVPTSTARVVPDNEAQYGSSQPIILVASSISANPVGSHRDRGDEGCKYRAGEDL